MFNTLSNAIETTVTEVVTSEITTEAAEIGFSTDNIRESLLCSAAGMVGIFVVIGIIILSVSILNKSGAKKKK